MITEDYVSFEVAKLLKEKGFDENINTYRDDFIQQGSIVIPLKESLSKDKVKTPTLQMAMKWLREVYHIHIEIHLDSMDGRHPIYEALYSECITIRTDNFIDYGDTYEEAVEAALKYCLTNLIKL